MKLNLKTSSGIVSVGYTLLVLSTTFIVHQAISQRVGLKVEIQPVPFLIRIEVYPQPLPALSPEDPALPNTLDNVAMLSESATLGG